MLDIYKKYREKIDYLIFGVLTTVLSLSVYYFVTYYFLDPNDSFELGIANCISWICGVLFAFATNKKYVFKSTKKSKREFFSFILGRLFSLLIDISFMGVTVNVFNLDDRIMKIISNVLVIILNYFISKFLVFKKDIK